jgi:hypothetical protein
MRVKTLLNLAMAGLNGILVLFSAGLIGIIIHLSKKMNYPKGKPTGYLRTASTDCYVSSDIPFLFLDSQHTVL